MSFALKELSSLIAGEKAVIGSVVGFSGGFVEIATAKGKVQARAAGSLVPGDRVTVRGGWAEKAPVATITYPV